MIFLVAEIGVNWDGDFNLVNEMMKNAKEAGFDAVKFQAYNEDIVKSHPEMKRLMKSAISKKNIDEINNFSKSVGIEWFCTPMYPEVVSILEPYVKRYKIREFDGRTFLKNNPSELVKRVLQTGKEIIVSVERNPEGDKEFNNSKIKWLYCVPKYPCTFSDLDFRNFKKFDGYSNHCPYLVAPLTAAILGARIIEVHVTSDKSKNFIDNQVSFDYNEQIELVKAIRETEKIKK